MIINYSISFQVLDRYIKDFNSRQEGIGTKVRQSMIATMKEVIKIYGVSLIKSHKVAPVDLDNLPSLRTNNRQLAKLTSASGRTIQRHIKRLLESGILIEKIWHGSHSSYELFINPKILWISTVNKEKNAPKETKQLSVENQEDKKIKTSKCPHSYTNKKTDKRNNILIGADKQRCSLSLTSFRDTEKSTQKETKKTRRKSPEEEARRKSARREEMSSKQRTTREIDAETRRAFLSLELWELAKKKLYKDTWLNKRQCHIGLALLRQWYAPVAYDKLDAVHKVYKARVHLVEKYISKSPETRFVTIPSLYFSINNPNGFRGTKPWYEAEKRHKKTLALKRIVREEIRKFKRNEAKDTAEARPRLTVFRECEQRISKLGLPKLLQEFYKAALPEQHHTSKNAIV